MKTYTIADKEEAKKLIGRKVKIVECRYGQKSHIGSVEELLSVPGDSPYTGFEFTHCIGSAFQLLSKTLDDIEVDDVLIISGAEHIVLGRADNVVFVSHSVEKDKVMSTMTIERMKKRGYTLKDSEPEEVLEFMECDTCRAKPGSPTLCRGCLHNRDVITKFGVKAVKIIDNK